MNDFNEDSQASDEKIMSICAWNNVQHKHQQLRFSQEEDTEEQQKKSLQSLSFQSPKRATRFLSIYDSSVQLPSTNLHRLKQLHNRIINRSDLSISDEIIDESLSRIPFKYDRT